MSDSKRHDRSAPPSQKLKSPKSVVVTGGASGIGQQICLQLLDIGWHVVAVDRNEEALLELPLDKDQRLQIIQGDVTDPLTLRRGREAAESCAEMYAWVNNAAILDGAPLHEIDDETIKNVLDVNLGATINGVRTAIQSFLLNGVPGAIVNLSSIHAINPFPSHPIYAATKGAIDALTRQICVEYAAQGIRCNAVAPGAVNTSMTTGVLANSIEYEMRLAQARLLSPMLRVSTPEEIANAVCFLLSDAAKSINGHILAVDNGMSAQGRALPLFTEEKFEPKDTRLHQGEKR